MTLKIRISSIILTALLVTSLSGLLVISPIKQQEAYASSSSNGVNAGGHRTGFKAE